MADPGEVERLASQSLRSRLMTCYALCAVAESMVRAGDLPRALEAARRVRSTLAEASLLLNDPTSITLSAVHECAEMVAEVNQRIAMLERAMNGSGSA